MKIAVVTQDEFFYIPKFFGQLLAKLDKTTFQIESIVILPTFNESIFHLAKRMYNFYGIFNFCRQGVKYVTTKLLDKLRLSANTVGGLARKHAIELRKPDDINDLDVIAELREKDLDLIISVAASQIFGERLLDLPKRGCINIHSAKLPKYRGQMPNFWTMYHSDKSAGITIHTMDRKIDRGKILLQEEIEILPNESLDSLAKRAKLKAADLVIEVLEDIRTGTVELKDYKGKGSYFSFPTKENVREFKRRGKKLL